MAKKYTNAGADKAKGKKRTYAADTKPDATFKESKKQKDTHGALYYALPWNLQREIGQLGYAFSTTKIFMIYGIVVFIMVLLGLFLQLSIPGLIPLVLAGLLFAPKMVRNSYKNKWEKKRFSDVNVYIEQMLYAFKNSQRILTSLQDVAILFPQGAMREVIDDAIEMISNPSQVGSHENAEEKALGLIAARYPNRYIDQLHRFMLKVEGIGGNFDSSVKLLLDSRQMWENRMLKLQDKRRAKRTEILMSCAVAMGLCVAMLYILPSGVEIGINPLVQVTNVVFIILLFMIFLKADTKLAANMLNTGKNMNNDKLVDDYWRYVKYDPQKALKTSIKFSIIPIVILVLGFIFKNGWVMGFGGVLLPIMLCQHILGHKLLEKRLKREIGQAFPQWLMELALLLQTDNVQVSIFKTVDTALPVLRPELEILRDKLEANPDSSEPFMQFFYKFSMPEITTSMQMLYSLSVGSGGDPSEQIANIVQRNNIILDRAEDMANEDSRAGLYTLFLAPVMLGAVVLMVDMTVFLMAFMQNMI